MRFLVVLAHPLKESFAAGVAATVREGLESKGHSVDFLDLYQEDFDPRLTAAERGSYFSGAYDTSAVSPYVARIKAADGLILVFPQWWFNLPAILKGFIDRVFVPGVAFENDAAGGRIIPTLTNIRYFWCFTTTGSPWWIVHFYMGNPLKRQLKRGVAYFCSKSVDFRMHSLHNMDHSTQQKRERFLGRVGRIIGRL
ncbi:NAD(P)H dehydrogenase (quinone) [Rhizobium sp. SG_E_25_P2]|uniref:NAD(P)H-dependent oxidoreductase n=1 Tax=Rhizobium sp. SG_E_25_P2 TaxID=2879942 RepID=UPI00247381FA|nr:NAD(P)H-dependent oxidoreductase [Rhizobium sp. SG_E_25_P2]MDH6265311.1 NAD(P)H dehydrogenase (quinone) [Rhizobium sp. SG_E_25_P2]